MKKYHVAPDVEMRDEGNYRIYFKGRIFDLYHSPLGPWALWTNKAEKLGEYPSYDDALGNLAGMFAF